MMDTKMEDSENLPESAVPSHRALDTAPSINEASEAKGNVTNISDSKSDDTAVTAPSTNESIEAKDSVANISDSKSDDTAPSSNESIEAKDNVANISDSKSDDTAPSTGESSETKDNVANISDSKSDDTAPSTNESSEAKDNVANISDSKSDDTAPSTNEFSVAKDNVANISDSKSDDTAPSTNESSEAKDNVANILDSKSDDTAPSTNESSEAKDNVANISDSKSDDTAPSTNESSQAKDNVANISDSKSDDTVPSTNESSETKDSVANISNSKSDDTAPSINESSETKDNVANISDSNSDDSNSDSDDSDDDYSGPYTFEQLKPIIDESLQILKTCDDFTTVEAKQSLDVLQFASHPDGCSNCDGVAKHLVHEGFGHLFVKMWNSLCVYLDKENWEKPGFANLKSMNYCYMNFTDVCPELGAELGKHGCIPLLLAGLEKSKVYFNQESDFKTIQEQIGYIFGILQNSICFCSSNREIYRNAGAVGVLNAYLKQSLVSTDALMILAYIVNEDESKLLAESEVGVSTLVRMLQQAAHSSNHKAEVKLNNSTDTFTAFEIASCLNHLAINDDNKRKIEERNGIPAITRMLGDDFKTEERTVAAELIWNMAFVVDSEQLQDALPALERFHTSTNIRLRSASQYAIWKIKGGRQQDISHPQEPPPTYEESIKEPDQTTLKTTANLMISYQWDSQETAKKVRDGLVRNGYRVWMDDTDMNGDILAAMAEAVEKSDIIMMLISERYKDSKNCRSEADYAYALNKTCIPIYVESGYKPDGWLGILLGNKLYYKCLSDAQIQEQIPALVKAINKASTTKASSKADKDAPGIIVPTHADEVTSAPPSYKGTPTQYSEATPSTYGTPTRQRGAHGPSSPSPGTPILQSNVDMVDGASPLSPPGTDVINWTEEDVQAWLKDNNLHKLCETLDNFNGEHLMELYKTLKKDADKFESEMKSDPYKLDAKVYLRFKVALKKKCKKAKLHVRFKKLFKK